MFSAGTMFWTFICFLIIVEARSINGDQCNWTGSGLSLIAENERAVRPVYLRCREGTVSWQYPRGALRLLLRPPMPNNEKRFTVCVRVIRREEPPDLFYTNDEGQVPGKAERFPARLFVEGPQKLVPLYAPDDGDPREIRCFKSKRGNAAIYVEAEPEDGTKRRVATLKYEARPLARRHYDPAAAHCRPCSDDELELAYCTGDLVSRAVILSAESREDLDSTELTLELTRLLRATGSVDAAPDTLPSIENYYRTDIESNSLSNSEPARARVQVPAGCGAGRGEGGGEHLVVARRRLGTYFLVCAPRAHHWDQLVASRRNDTSAYCVLQH